MKSPLLLLFACIVTFNASADESSQNHCEKPIIPNEQASPIVVKYFDKHMKEYKQCLSDIIDAQQAISKNSSDIPTANLAHAKAEAAIKEYNDFLELIKARDARAGKQDDDEGNQK